MASIHDAARAGDAHSVRSLLSLHPTSLNARDRHSRTPLHLASWAGHPEVVVLLCENKADVGAAATDDTAAIHFASQKGHTQVVRYLLAAGASVNARTRKGMTPLHFAVQSGHVELMKLLIRKGASLEAETKAGKRPIDLAKDEDFHGLILVAEQERNKPKLPQAIDKRDPSHSPAGSDTDTEAKLKESEEKPPIGNKLDEKNAPTATARVDQNHSEGNGGHAIRPKKKAKVELSHLAMDQED